MRLTIQAGLMLAAMVCLRAETLEAVLARMDASARDFHSFTAHVKETSFTSVINDSEVSNGTVRMKRVKGGVMGIVDFSDPDVRTIGIRGHAVEIYHPKAHAVEVYDTTKYTSAIDGYFLLGFGDTAADLNRGYDVKLGGAETLGEVATTWIMLVPKSPEVLKVIRQFDLWIPEGKSNPLQTKVFKQGSKDTITFLYSDLKVNGALPDALFELKIPPGTRRITPQK